MSTKKWEAGLTSGGNILGFVAFDAYKSLLEDADGKVSGPRTVIAGFGAGITESLLAVTPFESIKTQLYVSRSCAHKGPYRMRLLTKNGCTGLMIANRRIHECADFFTARPSSHANRA